MTSNGSNSGGFFSKLRQCLAPKGQAFGIMVIGLDNAGKTSILRVLKEATTYTSIKKPATTTKKTPKPTTRWPGEQASVTRATTSDGRNGKKSENFGAEREGPNDKCMSRADDVEPSDLDQLLRDHKLQLTTSTSEHMNLNLNSSRNPVVKDPITASTTPTIGYNFEKLQFRGHTLSVLDFSGQNKYRILWQEFVTSVDGIVFVLDSSDLIRLVVVRDELETLLSHTYFSTLKREPKPSGLLPMDRGSEVEASEEQSFATFQEELQLEHKKLSISQGLLHQTRLSRPDKSGCISRNFMTTRWKVPLLFLANKADLSESADTRAITEALQLDRLVDSRRHPWLVQATSVSMPSDSQKIVEAFDWLLKEMATGYVC